MFEQIEDFLPSEVDKFEKSQRFEKQNLVPLSDEEKQELSRLEKSSKQREIDINIFAPALDNIDYFFLPEEQKNQLWAEVKPEDIAKEKNNIVSNIKMALARELDLAENVIMELDHKQALIKKLEVLAEEIKTKNFDNFLGTDDLLFLRQIFNSRFTGLFNQQTRQEQLSVRSFAEYKEKY